MPAPLSRISAHEARRLVEQQRPAARLTRVDVREAAGRVVAEDLFAHFAVPHFARAAMDGYAVRSADVASAFVGSQTILRVAGSARPGRAFEGVLCEGEAVHITTGAPLPAGADAIVMVEDTHADGVERVVVERAVGPGKHVARVGEDVTQGTLVARQGRRLRAQDAGLLAGVGFAEVPVIERPSVAILVSGGELLRPGSTPSGPHIVDTNSVMLSALAVRDGARAPSVSYVRDEREAIERALRACEADVVLASGGSSVGAEDHLPGALQAVGNLVFHRVSMRPGGPAGFGVLTSSEAPTRLVFLLPGNPVACLAAYEWLAGPTIRALGGLDPGPPQRTLPARLGQAVASARGRLDYVRVTLDGEVATPIVAGASILSSTTRADGAFWLGESEDRLAKGDLVDVLLYD